MQHVVGLLHEVPNLLERLATQLERQQVHLAESYRRVSAGFIVADDEVHQWHSLWALALSSALLHP